jgi:acyl-coenzyme A thioesterase PaaI-like protein
MSLDVQFLGPVRIGDFAEIEAVIVRRTRSLPFLRGDLRVGDKVRGTAKGFWTIL